MSERKPEDATERAIQEALASVERIERESKTTADDDLDPDSIEVLPTSDTPPSGGPSVVDANEDIEEDVLLDTESEPVPGPRKTGSDAMLEAMISAKNELQNVLEQTQKEAQSMRDRLLRVSADFENYKKRQSREREQAIKFGNEGLLKELLPVLDNMDRAVESANQEKEGLSDSGKVVVEGISMVLRQFTETLKKFGVEPFTSLGTKFDPNRHEAMSQREDSTVPSGTVIEEYQRGYMLHERLVRPSMVIVSTGGPSESAKSADGEEE